MLDQCHAGNLTGAAPVAPDRTTQLPMPEDEFLAQQGPTPSAHQSRRSFHRFYFRGKGTLQWRGETLGIYTTDLSRKGMGLLAPLQLFPMERVTLHMSDGRECQLEIVRCRRVGSDCYECGARFAVGQRINEIDPRG